jgi:RNA polymerase sigma-70 factor (ECF subfamily)
MNRTIFQQEIYPIRNKLYRFALRITGCVHDAEDVVQEVLEKVWKTPQEQSELVRNWEAWCMTLTRNRSLDKSRSNSLRRTSDLDGVAEHEGHFITPEARAEQMDMASLVKRRMEDLPEKQRLVMHLRDIEGLTYDEIAQTLDITLDQVKTNLHRARKSIRAFLLTKTEDHQNPQQQQS